MKYFGTDGIRDKADIFTPEFLAKIIRGLIGYAGEDIKILLGGDTRESTEWILQDLATACETFGIEYAEVGVLPTPAINYCFYQMGYDFAIDITASHNPYTDNGIKIFERGESSGTKLSEKGCKKIEESLAETLNYRPIAINLKDSLHDKALKVYQDHLTKYLGENINLQNLEFAIDYANGATSVLDDPIFKNLETNITSIHINANYNTEINKNCGSTHLESLRELVMNKHYDLGIAFDGDGDRCLLIDNKGEVVDGDNIIAILANYLHLDTIAITVMANQGLLNWTNHNNIHAEITPVGDSEVAAAMRKQKIPIGGEQSGHIILPGEATGDGALTALMILKIISETGKSLHELASIITKSPQITTNFPATKDKKEMLKTNIQVKQLLLEYSKKLEPINGRLLIRPSGTEPLIRITMWGDSEQTITNLSHELSKQLGEIL